MRLRGRLWLGGTLNVPLWIASIALLSGQFMTTAEDLTGAAYAWPQIAFMSAYPADVRNGYFMVVAAVSITIFVSSGLCGALLGASPGKALLGVIYRTADRRRAPPGRMILRAVLLMLLVAPILLLGPILGFVFGPSADPYSMAGLFLTIVLAIATVTQFPTRSQSWVNRTMGLWPHLRRQEST